jgi:1,4-dihydroxy-2-naphthoyl-CoA synthase
MTGKKPDGETHIMQFKDIIYTEQAGVATITINRPKVYNAFNSNTCEGSIRPSAKPAGTAISASWC